MEPSEFRRHVNRLLAQDRKNPLGWWYLSFADEGGWRGAVFIQAHGPTEAVYLSNLRRLSPDGEVVVFPLLENEVPTEPYRNRLLSKAEVETMTGFPMKTLKEILEDEGEPN